MVERLPSKQKVAGSRPVPRSTLVSNADVTSVELDARLHGEARSCYRWPR